MSVSKYKNEKIWYSSFHKKKLSEFKIKNTFLRLKILTFVIEQKKPFSADDLIDSIFDTGIHKTTVYRNLDLFKEKGLLKEVDLRRDSVFYEYTGGSHHHHIVCTDCGCVEDFHSCAAESLTKEVLSKSKGFRSVSDHSFELFGLCNKCS